MKKTVLTAIALLLCASCAWASLPDVRLASMGGTYVADSTTCANPAFLHFRSEHSNIILNASVANAGPEIRTQGVLFSGDLMLSLSSDFSLDKLRDDPDSSVYDISKSIELGVSASVGTASFSAGIAVEGGSSRERTNVKVANGRRMLDMVQQTFLSEYQPVSDSGFLSVRPGLALKLGNIAFGVVLDDIIDHSGNDSVVTFESIVSNADAGFSFRTSQYGHRGKLNIALFTFSAQVNDMFRSEAALAAGAELVLQFLQEYTASARLGYVGPLSASGDASVSAGVGFRIGYIDVNAAAEAALASLSNTKVTVTLGYSR